MRIKKQIVHLSIHQTSKVIAAMHTAMLTVLFVIPSVLGYWYHGQLIFGMILLLLLPLLIWALMYIGYIIACWFYNLVVPWFGGIEIEVMEAGKSLTQQLSAAPPLKEDTVIPKQGMIAPLDEKDDL